MNVTLRPEVQAKIEEKLRNGSFESVDALVDQAVSFFLGYEDEEMAVAEFHDTKSAIDEALEQGEHGQGISLDDFDRTMRARHGIPR